MAQSKWLAGGDWDGARPYVAEFMQTTPDLHGSRVRGFLPAMKWLQFCAGDDPSALRDLEELVVEAERDGDIGLWALGQFWLAQWDALQGRKAEALARHAARAGGVKRRPKSRKRCAGRASIASLSPWARPPTPGARSWRNEAR